MTKFLFAVSALVLLSEPVTAFPAAPALREVAVGVEPTKTVTYARAAHRSSRRTARRVNRRY